MTVPVKILFAWLLLVLCGCASSPNMAPTMADMDILSKDDRFALVRLKRGQNLETLASAFFGDHRDVWQIREVNALSAARPGQIVAVPLKPVNPSGVYTDGYRTLPILCYHQFTAAKHATHRLELSAKAFEQQVRYLLDNNYQLLSFADVAAIFRLEKPMPKKAVVLTIDDGYESVFEVAWPILRKYRAKATLFVYTDFVGAGKALSWAQLREMADSGLIEVESHAKSHTSLAQLPGEQNDASYANRLQQEFSGSEAAFERYFGKRPVFLSYPYGNSSDTAARLLKASGYNLAATVTQGDNTSFTDPYLLHRTMIYDDHDMKEFARMLRTYRKKRLQ